jgi:hypothetical protein
LRIMHTSMSSVSLRNGRPLNMVSQTAPPTEIPGPNNGREANKEEQGENANPLYFSTNF